MISRIKELAAKYRERVIDIRNHLHQYPELSFQEFETSKFILNTLNELNIEVQSGLGSGTGLTAVIGRGDRTIALRADMDALPIQEQSEKFYRSQNSGVMHACGHDVHTSSLLGCAMILNELKDELNHKVKFIFQPGEEQLPGGASMMIKDGALENPKVSQILGQHVHPSLTVGKIGVKPGFFMASCDEIFITVLGRGGHGAMPHHTIDPIMISAELIQSLQSVVSRHADPNTPSVLTVGKIYSDGGATNVIPSSVSMEGTFRTFDEQWRSEAHELIRKRVKCITEAYDADYQLEIRKGYPSLYNDPVLTEKTIDHMNAYMGEENIVLLPQRMTAEDFSYYSHEVPACFYRLGTGSIDGSNSSPVHTPYFDIDPDALEVGMGLMSWLAYNG